MLQKWVMESWSCLACDKFSAGTCSTRRSCHVLLFLSLGFVFFGVSKLEAAQKIQKEKPSCAPAPWLGQGSDVYIANLYHNAPPICILIPFAEASGWWSLDTPQYHQEGSMSSSDKLIGLVPRCPTHADPCINMITSIFVLFYWEGGLIL